MAKLFIKVEKKSEFIQNNEKDEWDIELNDVKGKAGIVVDDKLKISPIKWTTNPRARRPL